MALNLLQYKVMALLTVEMKILFSRCYVSSVYFDCLYCAVSAYLWDARRTGRFAELWRKAYIQCWQSRGNRSYEISRLWKGELREKDGFLVSQSLTIPSAPIWAGYIRKYSRPTPKKRVISSRWRISTVNDDDKYLRSSTSRETISQHKDKLSPHGSLWEKIVQILH